MLHSIFGYVDSRTCFVARHCPRGSLAGYFLICIGFSLYFSYWLKVVALMLHLAQVLEFNVVMFRLSAL